MKTPSPERNPEAESPSKASKYAARTEDKKYLLPNITLNAFVSPRSGHKPMTLGQIRVISEDTEAKPPTPKRGHQLSPNRLRVGYNQVEDFYKTFQRLDRAIEFGEHKKTSKVAYMREVEKRKLYPNPSGIVAFSGKNKTIDASHHYMGNSRVAAFSKGLKYTEARHVDL